MGKWITVMCDADVEECSYKLNRIRKFIDFDYYIPYVTRKGKTKDIKTNIFGNYCFIDIECLVPLKRSDMYDNFDDINYHCLLQTNKDQIKTPFYLDDGIIDEVKNICLKYEIEKKEEIGGGKNVIFVNGEHEGIIGTVSEGDGDIVVSAIVNGLSMLIPILDKNYIEVIKED